MKQMKIKFRAQLLHLFYGFLSVNAGAATVTFSIDMGNVLNAQGQNIATGALFQLVGLGSDGVFNPFVAGSWVGGDDVLINQPFPNLDGWATAAAFDLTDGVGTPGEFTRQFTFTLNSNVFSGEKIGIRWFPTVMATDFGITTTIAGMPYGEFTRQSSSSLLAALNTNASIRGKARRASTGTISAFGSPVTSPKYGGSSWVVPSAASLVSFDPMITPSYDSAIGQDPNSTGLASLQVPEPGSATLAFMGAFLLGRRYRKRNAESCNGLAANRTVQKAVD